MVERQLRTEAAGGGLKRQVMYNDSHVFLIKVSLLMCALFLFFSEHCE